MSRLIKSRWASASDDNVKVIGIKKVQDSSSEGEVENPLKQEHLKRLAEEKEFILSQAVMESNSMIQQAQEEVAKLYEQLKDEQEQFQEWRSNELQIAKKEGYEIGLAEGRHTAQMEYESLLEQAKTIVQQSEIQVQQHLENAETTILRLSMEVAESILHDTLAESPEKFISLVKHAIKLGKEQKKLQLHVHPKMYELLINVKSELDHLLPPDATLTIFADDDLSTTTCFIESPAGRIDATVDHQLTELKSRLLQLLQEEKE
ncbi:flagellar assembly protein FliH [Mangrovibacillus cuniculi]|uniref:Flagellar assembly protein FliH n=1 Tax=Mangrovibacillus cuniculi TaxID=2593652 RepID=A0A7S8HF19_9BACI|nr:flagellar assembly protein FliH [Mangrovibacillus cuniculi]QPC46343.1 flagellar assembly protein FliH [Mangrovibacillus cuniculi]